MDNVISVRSITARFRRTKRIHPRRSGQMVNDAVTDVSEARNHAPPRSRCRFLVWQRAQQARYLLEEGERGRAEDWPALCVLPIIGPLMRNSFSAAPILFRRAGIFPRRRATAAVRLHSCTCATVARRSNSRVRPRSKRASPRLRRLTLLGSRLFLPFALFLAR